MSDTFVSDYRNLDVTLDEENIIIRYKGKEAKLTLEQWKHPSEVVKVANELGCSSSSLFSKISDAIAAEYDRVYSCEKEASVLPSEEEGLGEEGEIQPQPLYEIVKNAPEREWVVEKLIPLRAFIVLAGKAGVGKSFLGLLIAKSVSSQESFLNMFKNHNSKVLYVDEENDPSTLKERIKLLGNDGFENVDALILTGFKLDNDDHLELLENVIVERGYSLVILDCWTDLIAEIDENKAVEVNNILHELKRIAWRTNTSMLLIHHLRKNAPYVTEEKDELRGSSVLLNKPDIVMLFEQSPFDPALRTLKLIKNRFGEMKAWNIVFEQKDDRLEIKLAGEATVMENEVEKCIRVLDDFLTNVGPGEYRTKQLAEACEGFSSITKRRAVNILLARGILERVRKGIYRYKGRQAKLLESFDEKNGSGEPKNGSVIHSSNYRDQEWINGSYYIYYDPLSKKRQETKSSSTEVHLACRSCLEEIAKNLASKSEKPVSRGVCEYCGKAADLYRVEEKT